MPKVTVTLRVLVTLDVPAELAAQVTRDDLIEMAQGACPDSSTTPGPPNGTQVTVNGVCQFEGEGQEPQDAIFADVFVEHGFSEDADLELQDEGFTLADPDEQD